MKRYKGYYIDGVVFNNETEIDAFLEESAVKSFEQSVRLFAKNPSTEASMWQTGRAENLHHKYGYTWAEIERLEIEVLKTIARA